MAGVTAGVIAGEGALTVPPFPENSLVVIVYQWKRNHLTYRCSHWVVTHVSVNNTVFMLINHP